VNHGSPSDGFVGLVACISAGYGLILHGFSVLPFWLAGHVFVLVVAWLFPFPSVGSFHEGINN